MVLAGPDGQEMGPRAGSPGLYDVILILGIPGISSVATDLNIEQMLAKGDSLIAGDTYSISGQRYDGTVDPFVKIEGNGEGHLARVLATVELEHFAAADRYAASLLPLVSLLAFHADTPLDVTATVVTERSTGTTKLCATVIGAVQPAPTLEDRVPDPAIQALMASYREGLNSNSPLYAALCFYRVLEGAEVLGKQRQRRLPKEEQAVDDPMNTLLPTTPPLGTDSWMQDAFATHQGRSFREIKAALRNPLRNSISHLTPGRDYIVVDELPGVAECFSHPSMAQS